MPGSSKASRECLSFISDVLPHAVALLKNEKKTIVKDHKIIQSEGAIKSN